MISGANRANDEPFKLSFLENTLTSNPVLHELAAGHRKDVYGVIRMAESGSQTESSWNGATATRNFPRCCP